MKLFRLPGILALSAFLLCGFFLLGKRSREVTHESLPEWPEFRGPTQDGVSDARGLPTEWSTEKNIIWKTPLPGKAWSSPIVAHDRIYLTNAIAVSGGDDLHGVASLRVLALDATDGKVLWDQEVFVIEEPYSFGVNDKNSHASPTPVFDHDRIYAHFGHFGSACLDATGNIVWKTSEPAYKTEQGNGGSPIIVDDLMIFNCDGLKDPFVVALDKNTGRVRWETPRGKDFAKPYSLSTPLLIEVKGVKQIVTPGTHMVQSLDPKDGHEFWHASYPGYCVVPRPVYGHGLIFLATGFDPPGISAINPEGLMHGSKRNLIWTVEKYAPQTPSMVLAGDDLYTVSDAGVMSCLDALTGAVHWQERVGKSTSASLLYADGRIYLQDEFGKGYVIKPGPKLEVLATNDLADRSLASYAVHGSHLLIRTQHALWCLGKKEAEHSSSPMALGKELPPPS